MNHLYGISHIEYHNYRCDIGTYIKFLTFSFLALMTYIIPYDIRFYNRTIYGILPLTQGILHMNHGNKTLYNKTFLPCIAYIIFSK
jgi:hypothetical protein